MAPNAVGLGLGLGQGATALTPASELGPSYGADTGDHDLSLSAGVPGASIPSVGELGVGMVRSSR